MSWLDSWLRRGGNIIKRVGVGYSWTGDFLTAKNEECKAKGCGVKRKDHQQKMHPFVEV